MKKPKNCETIIHIYTNPDTLQKSRQFVLHFYSQKAKHFTLRYFLMKFLKLAFIYIQKAWHFPLRDVFIYRKSDTSKKARQFALWNFWNWRRGGRGIFINQKQCTLHYISICKKKQCTFRYGFYVQKSRHFESQLYMQKTMHFVLCFYQKCIA